MFAPNTTSSFIAITQKEKDEECRRGDYPYEKRDIRRI